MVFHPCIKAEIGLYAANHATGMRITTISILCASTMKIEPSSTSSITPLKTKETNRKL